MTPFTPADLAGPITCPDCTATGSPGELIRHDDTCPVSAALDHVSRVDREWFAAHPDATEYRRDLLPGDLSVASLDAVLLGTADGKPARVTVRQIGPGLRVRALPGNLVVRVDTLDALRVVHLLTTAPTVPDGWSDALIARGTA
jgi:hypothetical protein